MRNSIRKIASLCLAMAMILSTMAMPAFAEERAVHTCVYNQLVTSDTNPNPIPWDNERHAFETVTYYSCEECGRIGAPVSTYRYAAHLATGSGTLDYSYTDPTTGTTVYYYSFTCSACGDTFVRARY